MRSTLSENVVSGDEAFYKCNDKSEWHGPGIVIGRDGKQISVRHGGTYVRVHACRFNRSVTELDKTRYEKVDMVLPRVESVDLLWQVVGVVDEVEATLPHPLQVGF